MKTTLDYFYGIDGTPAPNRLTNFKTTLFGYGDTPAITVDTNVAVGFTVSSITTTAGFLVSGAGARGLRITGAMSVTGISISGATLTGITISSVCTTSIALTGATESAIAILGTPTLAVSIGTNANPIVHAVYTSKSMAIYNNNTSTSGASGEDYEPVLINTVMEGAGQVGGRVRIHMDTNVTLGGWANALKASVDLRASGGVTGLLSAICAEVTAAARAQIGTQCVLELELVTIGSATFGGACSLVYSNISGNSPANASFLRNGSIWRFDGLGAADSDPDIFHTNGGAATTHGLRISIAGVMYDILMSTSTYG